MSFARSDFAVTSAAFEREWLVTNSLGGFACGTVSQANTRRYHGLLVAALQPPVQRVVMVAKLEALVRYRGRIYELGSNEFADGTVSPRGFELLSAFEDEGGLPVWTYACGDARLEQRIWMANGRNTTYVRFQLCNGSAPLQLELRPLCTYRDYHSHSHGGWSLDAEGEPGGCRVTAFAGARPYRLLIDRGEFRREPDWYWRFRHRVEADRGLDAIEDLWRPGTFHVSLESGDSVTVIATAESEFESPAAALEHERSRRRALQRAVPAHAPDWVRRLTLAADQFIVRRSRPNGEAAGTTVIAGYPWFSDWGRDTMIALPGLALATGRIKEAGSILRTFAAHVSQGMLPNRFPDGGEPPEYNTVDATLWYFHAIAAYLDASGDRALLRDLYPVLRDIVDWHRRGTRYAIRVDTRDGLLFAGERGVQLTWMDAKIGDWVVTPRIGKPVEINALWHYALTQMAAWARELKDRHGAADYGSGAARVAASFSERYWYAPGGYLYDVIDDPSPSIDADGRSADHSLRPNQIFAVSLGSNLLDAERARAVVDVCARELLTPVGLRSLATSDPHYVCRYSGDPRQRDAAYHQGTVWTWLLGPYVLAHHKVYGDTAHALALLEGLASHLDEGCIGSISEIMDGDAPHSPRGCFAQAWGVSETLRAFHSLNAAQARRQTARTVGD